MKLFKRFIAVHAAASLSLAVMGGIDCVGVTAVSVVEGEGDGESERFGMVAPCASDFVHLETYNNGDTDLERVPSNPLRRNQKRERGQNTTIKEREEHRQTVISFRHASPLQPTPIEIVRQGGSFVEFTLIQNSTAWWVDSSADDTSSSIAGANWNTRGRSKSRNNFQFINEPPIDVPMIQFFAMFPIDEFGSERCREAVIASRQSVDSDDIDSPYNWTNSSNTEARGILPSVEATTITAAAEAANVVMKANCGGSGSSGSPSFVLVRVYTIFNDVGGGGIEAATAADDSNNSIQQNLDKGARHKHNDRLTIPKCCSSSSVQHHHGSTSADQVLVHVFKLMCSPTCHSNNNSDDNSSNNNIDTIETTEQRESMSKGESKLRTMERTNRVGHGGRTTGLSQPSSPIVNFFGLLNEGSMEDRKSHDVVGNGYHEVAQSEGLRGWIAPLYKFPEKQFTEATLKVHPNELREVFRVHRHHPDVKAGKEAAEKYEEATQNAASVYWSAGRDANMVAGHAQSYVDETAAQLAKEQDTMAQLFREGNFSYELAAAHVVNDFGAFDVDWDGVANEYAKAAKFSRKARDAAQEYSAAAKSFADAADDVVGDFGNAGYQLASNLNSEELGDAGKSAAEETKKQHSLVAIGVASGGDEIFGADLPNTIAINNAFPKVNTIAFETLPALNAAGANYLGARTAAFYAAAAAETSGAMADIAVATAAAAANENDLSGATEQALKQLQAKHDVYVAAMDAVFALLDENKVTTRAIEEIDADAYEIIGRFPTNAMVIDGFNDAKDRMGLLRSHSSFFGADGLKVEGELEEVKYAADGSSNAHSNTPHRNSFVDAGSMMWDNAPPNTPVGVATLSSPIKQMNSIVVLFCTFIATSAARASLLLCRNIAILGYANVFLGVKPRNRNSNSFGRSYFVVKNRGTINMATTKCETLRSNYDYVTLFTNWH